VKQSKTRKKKVKAKNQCMTGGLRRETDQKAKARWPDGSKVRSERWAKIEGWCFFMEIPLPFVESNCHKFPYTDKL
jgi:hypothetical protein